MRTRIADMIVKLALVPLLFVIAGLVLLGIAMLAPVRPEAPIVSAVLPASERIRDLERASRGPNAAASLRFALNDPDPQVSAVAAILLRDFDT